MKRLLLVVAAAFAAGGTAFGEDSMGKWAGEGEHFQEKKAEMLKDMDARIGALQKMRDCVAGAAGFRGRGGESRRDV